MSPTDGTVSWPLFSRFLLPSFHKAAMAHGQADHRRRLLAGLNGRVVELGAGDGVNFPFYPDTVTEVLAIEPENRLRARAEERAGAAAPRVRVVPGWSDMLPGEDATFDAAVASLVLCSVPDQDRALAELFRVVRQGGELRFYEHVRANSPRHARVQRIVEPVWHRVGGGCHPSRDTTAAIERSGFLIEECDRFSFAPSLLARIGAPHIIGVARRP
jgi:ubiquinone/menaquinone biosynthesis C-methylase UbiE